MKQITSETDSVGFSYPDGTDWALRKSDIVLVGEYTTQEGPGGPDHFICVVDTMGNRYDVSDEDGASFFLKQLSWAFKHSIEPLLTLSTDFRSCILYPPASLGLPLFIEPAPGATFIQNIKKFFFDRQHELKLSNEAEALIRSKS